MRVLRKALLGMAVMQAVSMAEVRLVVPAQCPVVAAEPGARRASLTGAQLHLRNREEKAVSAIVMVEGGERRRVEVTLLPGVARRVSLELSARSAQIKRHDVDIPVRIEAVEFADGTRWSEAQ